MAQMGHFLCANTKTEVIAYKYLEWRPVQQEISQKYK
jgi:hypothetical protein